VLDLNAATFNECTKEYKKQLEKEQAKRDKRDHERRLRKAELESKNLEIELVRSDVEQSKSETDRKRKEAGFYESLSRLADHPENLKGLFNFVFSPTNRISGGRGGGQHGDMYLGLELEHHLSQSLELSTLSDNGFIALLDVELGKKGLGPRDYIAACPEEVKDGFSLERYSVWLGSRAQNVCDIESGVRNMLYSLKGLHGEVFDDPSNALKATFVYNDFESGEVVDMKDNALPPFFETINFFYVVGTKLKEERMRLLKEIESYQKCLSEGTTPTEDGRTYDGQEKADEMPMSEGGYDMPLGDGKPYGQDTVEGGGENGRE